MKLVQRALANAGIDLHTEIYNQNLEIPAKWLTFINNINKIIV